MGGRLTEAQRQALVQVSKRDWPGGEPRVRWLHKGTAARLFALGLIEERKGSEAIDRSAWGSPIVDLTDAGRQALKDGA